MVWIDTNLLTESLWRDGTPAHVMESGFASSNNSPQETIFMEVERFVLPLYSLAELRMVICGWNFVIQIL